MGNFRFWAVLLLFVLAGPVQAGSLSGTYVGIGPDIAVLLQLVDTGGGQLTGRYEQVKLSPGPKIDRFDATVKGNAGEGTIVLQVTPAIAFSGAYVMSGTVLASGLRLSGGGHGATFDLPLSATSEDTFNSQVSKLNNQASQMTATNNLAAAQKRLDALLQRMTDFNSRSQDELKKFGPYEAAFKAQTKAMELALAKQQTFPRSAVAIQSQFNGNIYRAEGQSTQLYGSIQTARSDFQTKSTALLNEVNTFVEGCRLSSNLGESSEPLKNWNSACSQLPAKAGEFRSQAAQILASFEHIEKAWQEEDRKQQAIMKSSDIALR